MLRQRVDDLRAQVDLARARWAGGSEGHVGDAVADDERLELRGPWQLADETVAPLREGELPQERARLLCGGLDRDKTSRPVVDEVDVQTFVFNAAAG